MDVRLPDGTVIQNVPEGTTKAELTAKLKANGYDVSKLEAAPAPLPAPSEGMPGPRTRPAWAETNPNLYSAAVTARKMAGPTIEALGAIGGGALGTVGATPGFGTLAGAGAGYAGARQVLRIADQYLGLQPNLTPQEAVLKATEDIVTGSTLEAGGRVAGQVLTKGAEKFLDARRLAELKAGKIARESLGPNVTVNNLGPAARALQEAPEGATAAQALAAPGVYQPTTQALLERAAARVPESMGPVTGPMAGVTPAQQQEAINTLAAMAGGSTATDVRAATEAAKNQLTESTRLGREMAFTRANLGQEVARFEAQAGKLSDEAAAKVEEVRRLIKAGDLATAAGRLELIRKNIPVGFAKYTYPGELAKMADDWASQAANASLDLGQGARFNEAAAAVLRERGIKPLEGEALVRSLDAMRRNPEFAGNDLIDGALQNVAADIAKWTKSNGIIDAKALDAIRMNSVNAAIAKLRPGADATAQRNMAAGVLTRIRPAIVDAIEDAGGQGYREYLADYAKGAQKIAEQKLTGEALRLWKTNRDEFVRLVMNESPETVEKFLGPGKYNIGLELAQSTMGKLSKVAETAQRAGAASEQAGQGKTRLAELLEANLPKWRLPRALDVKTANVNKALDVLEQKLGKKVWTKLTEAATSADSFEALLKTVPASERYKILQVINNPAQFGMVKGAAAREVSNALAPESENALAR